MKRVPVLVGIAGLLVAGGVADRWVDRSAPRPVSQVGTVGMPIAAPATALSSTWYCPRSDGITVANPTGDEVQGTVTVVPDQGEAKSVPITVKPVDVASVKLADVVQAAHTAALVDLDGGQVVVEHWLAGSAGTSVAPCASAASTQWYFAAGSTAKDAQLLLGLYNPFPEDAIVDLSFSTEQGRAVPADFQGIVVPAGRLVVKDIGEHVRRRDAISTHAAVRSGRVVAGQTLTRTEPGQSGVSLRLGAPTLAETWYFPDGYVVEGLIETYTLFNPGEEEALVDLEVRLDDGDAEPFELTVPPHGRVEVVTNGEDRLPKGVGRAAVVRSVNRVGVVAERSVGSAPPAPRAGRVDILGSPRSARNWLFAVGAATPTADAWLIVYNPGDDPATVDVTALAGGTALPIEGLQRVTVAPGRRWVVRVGEHIQRDALPLLVRSDVAVVAERAVYVVGGAGVSDDIGIPLD